MDEPPTKAVKQPRKSRKKIVDDDDDWDGDVLPKAKTKPKSRPKPKNAKKGKQDPASLAPNNKGKEKAKAPTSREFVEDSEGEGGGLILPPLHVSPSEKMDMSTPATLDDSAIVLDESELSSLESEIEVRKPGAGKQKAKAIPAKTTKRTKTKGRQQLDGVVLPAIIKGKKRAADVSDDEADVARPPNSHDDDLVPDERRVEDEPRKPDSGVKVYLILNYITTSNLPFSA